MAKLKIAGTWAGLIEVELENWTVPMLREEVAKRSNMAPLSVNLICAGKVLKDGDGSQKLSQLGIKNNSRILATRASADEGKASKEQMVATEELSRVLSPIKMGEVKHSLEDVQESVASLNIAEETTATEIKYVPIVTSCNDRIRPLLDGIDKLRHLNVAKEGVQLPTIVVVGDQSSGKSSETTATEIKYVPIVTSYNDRIRPLLDAIDKLRHLNVAKEGVQLPTIVVVGDQSSGKSSVLESLAGISLPRGQGICTRVPLIMRLQHHPTLEPVLYLEFNGKVVPTNEADVADAIRVATNEIAGNGKGISNNPLTLVVIKNGVPDLTMVDLPGITRVPVHGQPEDIYEQIRDTIMECIKPEESIILNVLSATVDFSTCESIRMSQQVDKTGERTLAVVTKADKAPEGLLEKVTADDVNIGLGYVCVRNRINDESYEEAREEEASLFKTHPQLSRISKSMVGIPVLAQKLVKIQATIIARCLPEIVKKINEKLDSNICELNRMPKIMSSVPEAMTAFVGIMGSAEESLRKILLRGEYDEFPVNKNMHCTARLVEMLNAYSADINDCPESDPKNNFLMQEIEVLEEMKGVHLPNFLPRIAFVALLRAKVERISKYPVNFIEKVWKYLEDVVIRVLMHHSENYNQLQSLTRRAGRNLVEKMKEQSMNWVKEYIEMEKVTDYTCDLDYMTEWNKPMAQKTLFVKNVLAGSTILTIDTIGDVSVGGLVNYKHVLNEAYDLKMRMVSYWKIVLRRLVDVMALHLQLSIRNLVNKEMRKGVVDELMGRHGGAIEKMLEESPSVAAKREKLNMSVKLLNESKEVLANVMDRIAATYDD